MSALETPAIVAPEARPLRVQRRSLPGWLGPAAVSVVIAIAYLVVLVVRYPQLISWQNADSDVASSYVVAAAAAHGGLGQIQLSTQGSWLEIGFMALTAGLRGHRLIWELTAPALSLITVGLLVRSVAGVGGRRPAWLSAAMLVSASPIVLMCAVSVSWHNTTPLGAVVLGTHLNWLVGRDGRARRTGQVALSALVVGLVAGFLVACDQLLGIVGVLPYVVAAIVLSRGPGGRRLLLTVIETACAAVLGWAATLLVTRVLDFRVASPPFQLDLGGITTRVQWWIDGVLRIGNGRWYTSHSPLLLPLILACGLVTFAALVAMFTLMVRVYRRRAEPAVRIEAIHVCFWTVSALCAAVAYVVTSQANQPSDRYLVITMYAVAATVPLLLGAGIHVRRAVLGSTAIFITGSLVALSTGEIDNHQIIVPAPAVAHETQIERVVRAHHLGIGFAGYWNAEALQWSSHASLRVYPLITDARHAAPMLFERAAAWYRPRRATPSYLLMGPSYEWFSSRLPGTLPRPTRIFHLGDVTIDAWPYDIAAWFYRSLIPVPAITAQQLRQARRSELRSAGS